MKNTQQTPIKIGILIYDGFDSLDVAGPNQIFYFFTKFSGIGELYLIGPEKGGIVTSLEGLKWTIDLSYSDITDDLDVLFVPGGVGKGFNSLLLNTPEHIDALLQTTGGKYDAFYQFLLKQVAMADKAYKEKRRERPQLVCAVCTGALLLARAGLLNGYLCTTHWAFKNVLSLFPKVMIAPDYPRVIVDRNRITGGGISSGIDEALAIVEIISDAEMARQIQLAIQYAPNPVYQSGDPSVAKPSTLYAVSNRLNTTELYLSMQKNLRC